MTKKPASDASFSLTEFVEGADDILRAFAARYQAGVDAGEFKRRRTEVDWWAEVYAYVRYVELEELARQVEGDGS